MMRFFFLFFLFLGGCTNFKNSFIYTSSHKELASAVANYYVNEIKDESCSVAIISPTDAVFANAGNADEHSLYRIASLTKFFLHDVFLRLEKKEIINLNSSITSYSKFNLPPEYEEITLNDLLFNQSGLPREFIDKWNLFDVYTALSCGFFGTHIYGAFDSREDFEKTLWQNKWRCCVKKGEKNYSNVGFALLGLAIEDYLNEKIENLLHCELCEPLNLQETTFAPESDNKHITRACAGSLPWLIRHGASIPENRLGSALRATGSLFSSTYDCAKFFSSYWRIIDDELAITNLDALADEDYFGLLSVKILPNKKRFLYRQGMIYGGSSFVGFNLEKRTIVLILRNVTSWPDEFCFSVMNAL